MRLLSLAKLMDSSAMAKYLHIKSKVVLKCAYGRSRGEENSYLLKWFKEIRLKFPKLSGYLGRKYNSLNFKQTIKVNVFCGGKCLEELKLEKYSYDGKQLLLQGNFQIAFY